MASKREILGGLVSVALHAGLLAWVAVQEPPDAEPSEPIPVEVEILELGLPTPQPLALRADSGRDLASPSLDLPRGEVAEPKPELAPAPRPRVSQAKTPETPESPDEGATLAPVPEEEQPEQPSSTSASAPPDRAGNETGSRPWGVQEGSGRTGTGQGGLGTDGTPDHSAYGAELVRLILAEIDEDPVPGLGVRDSIEVELAVLPSGRLAWRGLGKYDYARVVRSTLGPMRMRAILRRILRASEGFPPHPGSFPRERYVVGITVRFSDLRG